MTLIWILLGILAVCAVMTFLVMFICYYKIFYSPKKRSTEKYPLPDGKIYEEYRDVMVAWMKAADQMPHRTLSVRSFDGFTLRGNYYEYEKGAPIEILFHGYHGSARRDLSGGVVRCFALGHSALIVDYRGSGESDGNTITFGILERRDVHLWVELVLREIDPNAQIILTGISMGAATVLMCSADDLPVNVVGVLADCGYTSAREIICKVMWDMKLPAKVLYPFVRLGAKLFGKFDLDEYSPHDAMYTCRLPVIFFHGNEDDFVPNVMSLRNYMACRSEEKRFVLIEGAGHGLAFPKNQEKYLEELRSFFDPILEKHKNTIKQETGKETI